MSMPSASLSGSSTERSLDSWGFIGRVVVPFAIGHFLSYVLRTINAVVAPALATTVSLDAGRIGVLTSAYFLAFGLAQLPVGMALDRFGPRQVQAVLLVLAATGCLWFGAAHSFAEMVAARALTGFGLAACYMASLKAMSEWVPSARMPTMSGVFLAVGGIGAIASTLPAQYALDTIGQSNLFFAVGGAILVAWLMIIAVVPEPVSRERRPLPSLRSLLEVYRDPTFRRTVGVVLIPHTAFFAIQGLWLGAWLTNGAGFSPQLTAAYLCAGMLAMVVGTLITGRATEWASSRGYKSLDVAAVGLWLFVITQALIVLDMRSLAPAIAIGILLFGAFAGLEFAIVAQSVPRSLTGRASTCLNILVFFGSFVMQAGFGAIVNAFPADVAKASSPVGYRVAFAMMLLLQLPGLVLWLVRKLRQLNVGAQRQ
jgi:predicted MFS family arabinose efflux permease